MSQTSEPLTRTLHIGDLTHISELDIVRACSIFGEIVHCKLIQSSSGDFALLEFANQRDADSLWIRSSLDITGTRHPVSRSLRPAVWIDPVNVVFGKQVGRESTVVGFGPRPQGPIDIRKDRELERIVDGIALKITRKHSSDNKNTK